MSVTGHTLSLQDEIAAYDAMQDHLEDNYFGKWVFFYKRELVNAYDSYKDAYADAVRRFGKGPFLIRLVGHSPEFFPAPRAYSRWEKRGISAI